MAVFGAEYGVTAFVLYGPEADGVIAHRAFAGPGAVRKRTALPALATPATRCWRACTRPMGPLCSRQLLPALKACERKWAT